MELHEVTLEIASDQEIWELIDKRLSVVFLHKFMPNEVITWWKTDLKTDTGLELKNASVRQMEFDLQTDLAGLRQIINTRTYQLRIYQFEKPVPDTLVLEYLPEKKRNQILRQNGLHHIFFLNFEFITIQSFYPDYLKQIAENPLFKERMDTASQAFTTDQNPKA